MKERTTPGLKTRPPAVTDKASATAFVRWAAREIGPVYHPDSLAADYEQAGTDEASFTVEEQRLINKGNEAAFKFLEDPSEIVLDVWEEQLQRQGHG